jgi:hypothetical protein
MRRCPPPAVVLALGTGNLGVYAALEGTLEKRQLFVLDPAGRRRPLIVCTISDDEMPDRLDLIDRLRTALTALDHTDHGLVCRSPPVMASRPTSALRRRRAAALSILGLRPAASGQSWASRRARTV